MGLDGRSFANDGRQFDVGRSYSCNHRECGVDRLRAGSIPRGSVRGVGCEEEFEENAIVVGRAYMSRCYKRLVLLGVPDRDEMGNQGIQFVELSQHSGFINLVII